MGDDPYAPEHHKSQTHAQRGDEGRARKPLRGAEICAEDELADEKQESQERTTKPREMYLEKGQGSGALLGTQPEFLVGKFMAEAFLGFI
jgi:hypothetical protein